MVVLKRCINSGKPETLSILSCGCHNTTGLQRLITCHIGTIEGHLLFIAGVGPYIDNPAGTVCPVIAKYNPVENHGAAGNDCTAKSLITHGGTSRH